MSEETTWVKAVVDQRLYPNLPGGIITLWGHRFQIYADKSLCMEMHNDFVANEVKAGRVSIMNTLPPGVVELDLDIPEHKEVTVIPEQPKFTADAETFYGHGDMNKLVESLGKYTNPKIREFVKSRFDVVLPNNMNKADMLDEVRTLTDLEIISKKDD